MARSPDYLRLAVSATRTLAEAAFDSVREAVLVVDSRPKHLPVVLANEAARGCLAGDSEPAALAEASLYGLMGAASAWAIEALLASLSDQQAVVTRPLAWRFPQGESEITTEFKLLDPSQGGRLVMLSFAAGSAFPDLSRAVDQLPLGLMILDARLHVTSANASAVRSSGRAGGLVGSSALALAPTSALPRTFTLRPWKGNPTTALRLRSLIRVRRGAASTSTCGRLKAPQASWA